MHLKLLSKKFDKEIREECDNFLLKLNSCLKMNNNDEFQCRETIIQFKSCKENFVQKFYKKFDKYNIRIYTD